MLRSKCHARIGQPDKAQEKALELEPEQEKENREKFQLLLLLRAGHRDVPFVIAVGEWMFKLPGPILLSALLECIFLFSYFVCPLTFF